VAMPLQAHRRAQAVDEDVETPKIQDGGETRMR